MILGICAAVVGCGDGRDVEPASELERSAALELIDQTRALGGLTNHPTDRAALIASLRFDAVATLLAPNRAPTHWAANTGGGALLDCVTATDTTATFFACEIDGHWVDGTLSHAGPNVNAEIVDVSILDVFVLDAGSQGATSIDGAVILAPRLVDGTLSFDATWRQGERDIALAAKISFESVTLDDSGCPIGGSLHVVGTLSVPMREAERTLHFGSACGDVSIGR